MAKNNFDSVLEKAYISKQELFAKYGARKTDEKKLQTAKDSTSKFAYNEEKKKQAKNRKEAVGEKSLQAPMSDTSGMAVGDPSELHKGHTKGHSAPPNSTLYDFAQPSKAAHGEYKARTTEDGKHPHTHECEITADGRGKTTSISSGPDHMHVIHDFVAQTSGEDGHGHGILMLTKSSIAAYHTQSAGVDLEEHIRASGDETASVYRSMLKSHLQGLDISDVRDFPVETEHGIYRVNFFKKEPNLFSGDVRDPHGTLIQEFDNQTIEIISSMMKAKMGDLMINVAKPATEDYDSNLYEGEEKSMDDGDKMYELEMSLRQENEDVTRSLEKEIMKNALADEAMNMLTDELNDKGHTVVEIGDKIKITLLKAKELEMGFAKELSNKLEKAGVDQKDPNFNKKIDKEPSELQEGDLDPQAEGDVLSEVGAGEADQNPVVNSEENPQDQGDPLAGDAAVQDMGAEEGAEDQMAAQGDAVNIQAQGDNIQEQAELGVDESGLEYIKASDHAGGKQFWYKDPGGKIIEQDMAPDGHPDNMMAGGDLGALTQQIAEMAQKVDAIYQVEVGGGEGGELPAAEGEDMQTDQMEMAPSDAMPPEESGEAMEGVNGGAMAEGLDAADTSLNGEITEDAGTGMNGSGSPSATPGLNESENQQADKQMLAKDREKGMMKSLKEKFPKANDEALRKAYQKAKVLSSLRDKFPGIDEERLHKAYGKLMKPGGATKHDRCVEDVESNTPGVDNAHAVCVAEGVMPENSGRKKASVKKGHGYKKMKKSLMNMFPHLTEDQAEDAINEATNRYERSTFKKFKKSKLGRMWKVFGIDMPDALDTPEALEKANGGIKKLQRCILKQGKEETEINRVVNRAIIEKYDLLNKGSKYFDNFDAWKGGQNFNTSEEGDVKTPREMEKLRKSDADKRFSVKEYFAHREELVTVVKTDINQRVESIVNPGEIDWSDKG